MKMSLLKCRPLCGTLAPLVKRDGHVGLQGLAGMRICNA